MFDFISCILFCLSAEHQSSPLAEMGDTLEFNEIYQEVKGSWVSIIIHNMCLGNTWKFACGCGHIY